MIKLINLHKTYKSKHGVTFRALRDVNLEFASKGMVFVLGKSGSGKSTLLNLIGGLDNYDEGDIIVDDRSMSTFSEAEYDNYRSTYLGFVFQDYNIIKSLSVYDNIKISLNLERNKDYKRIDEVLNKLGIAELRNRKASNISGGQKQRVAIARAIVKNPNVILADEPTGSLDSKTGREIFEILKELSSEKLVIVVSHDKELAKKYGDRIIEIKDGEVYKDLDTSKTTLKTSKQNFSLISNSIVKVKGNKLTKDNIEDINESIRKNKRDSFVSFETDKNKVRSMYPHLKEVVTEKEVEKDSYKQYKLKEKNNSTLKLNKSRLSFIDALKLGFNNLFVKKFSLILLVIVTMLSLSLFALSDDISTFKIEDGITTSIKRSDSPFVVISDASYTTYNKQTIYNLSLNNLENKYDDFVYYNSYDYDFELQLTNDYSMLSSSFNGFIEVNTAEDLGLSILAKSNSLFNDYNNIMISSIMADAIIKNEYAMFDSYENLLDNSIYLNNLEYVIGAIYDGSSENYTNLLDIPEEYRYYENNFDYFSFANAQYLSRIVVKEGFKDYIANIDTIYYGHSLNINNATLNSITIGSGTSELLSEVSIVSDGLSEGEYFVSVPVLATLLDMDIPDLDYLNDNQIAILDAINVFNQSSNNYYFDNMFGETRYVDTDFRIEGIIISLDNFIRSSEEVINSISVSDITVNQIFVPTSFFYTNTHEKVSDIVNLNLGFYEYYSDSYKDLYSIKNVIEGILNTLSIILAFVVVLLFYNFISNSIRSSHKQIGLLRALGAKKNDIVYIYVLESVFITIFSIIFMLILYALSGNIINMSLSMDSDYYMGMISFKLSSILKTLYLALGVLVLSVILPFYRLLKLSPMDAINDK